MDQVDGVDRRTLAGKPTEKTWGDSGIRQDERMELERLRLVEVGNCGNIGICNIRLWSGGEKNRAGATEA